MSERIDVEVHGRPGHALVYARVVGLFGSLLGLILLLESRLLGATDPLLGCAVILASLGIGVAHAGYALTFPARVTYRCDGVRLVALRGRRETSSVMCGEVAVLSWSFQFNPFRLRDLFFDIPDVSMPRLVIELRGSNNSGATMVELPPILIVGPVPQREFLAGIESLIPNARVIGLRERPAQM